MYGGAKGGGKSWLFCVWVIMWLNWLIEFFDLKEAKTPEEYKKLPIIGFIGRKQSVDFTKTTYETWKKIVPIELYQTREHDKEIIWRRRCKLWYGGLDDRKLVNKFNSAELAFFGLDQAEETERVDVEVLQLSLRFKIGDKVPPYKELYTANPADCWLKEDFIDNVVSSEVREMHYVPALPSDNPHLPDTYCARLEHALRHSPAMLAAYLHGDWNALQATNACITSLMLAGLKGVTYHWKDTRTLVVCDPSLGGDECVIYVMRNYKIVEEKIIVGERDTMKIAGRMVALGQKWHTWDYAVDVIGIGQGIADRITELNPSNKVQYIQSAGKATDEEGFANLRMEMWWYAMEMCMEKKIPYPEDEELRRQIIAPRFKIISSSGKRQLEDKGDVKKRSGHGMDRADTWIYGVWATQFVEPNRRGDKWENESAGGEVTVTEGTAMSA